MLRDNERGNGRGWAEVGWGGATLGNIKAAGSVVLIVGRRWRRWWRHRRGRRWRRQRRWRRWGRRDSLSRAILEKISLAQSKEALDRATQ